MTAPLVSVCIVTFNHERYIHDCIMSVIAQSKDVALEILIGDDHSDDGTSAIIKKLGKSYPDIIHYIRHPERLGYGSKNYQTLLKKARGTYIAHLDGDDYWLPGKLRTQVSFLKQNPLSSAVYTNALVVKDNNEPVGIFNNTQPTIFNINYLLQRGNFLNNSSMLYRERYKSNIMNLEAPFIDYNINLHHALEGPIGYINQALTVYRLNSSSSVLAQSNDRIRNLYWKSLLDIPKDSISTEALAGCMSEFARSVFFRSIKIRQLSLFRQWFPMVLKTSPVEKTKMFFLVISAIFRVAAQELFACLSAKISKNPIKILYRR